jgi:hypothetical protein
LNNQCVGNPCRASDEQTQTAFTSAGFEFKLDLIPGFGHGWHSASCGLFIVFEKDRPHQHNWIRPALSFKSPAPSEKWEVGTPNTINWWLGCGNSPYTINLELSTNGPSGPYSSLDTITQSNYGLKNYDWNIPGSTPPTINAVSRATITDSSAPQKTNVSTMN